MKMRRSPLLIAALLCGAPGMGEELPSTNTVGMAFIRVQPGEMRVGVYHPSAMTAEDARKIAGTVFRGGTFMKGFNPTPDELRRDAGGAKRGARAGFVVKIDHAYALGVTEVTQAQWKAVMGSNPSVFTADKYPGDADSRPVDSISWQDAQEFIRRLNALEKTTVYRLPTEWEWEYAARAGAPGDMPSPPFSEQAVGGYNAALQTEPVRTKKPNAWGFYDMLGNVWEWTADFDNGEFFADREPPKTGSAHVIKGGSFLSNGGTMAPAVHAAGPASGFDVGLRVVRDVGPSSSR